MSSDGDSSPSYGRLEVLEGLKKTLQGQDSGAASFRAKAMAEMVALLESSTSESTLKTLWGSLTSLSRKNEKIRALLEDHAGKVVTLLLIHLASYRELCTVLCGFVGSVVSKMSSAGPYKASLVAKLMRMLKTLSPRSESMVKCTWALSELCCYAVGESSNNLRKDLAKGIDFDYVAGVIHDYYMYSEETQRLARNDYFSGKSRLSELRLVLQSVHDYSAGVLLCTVAYDANFPAVRQLMANGFAAKFIIPYLKSGLGYVVELKCYNGHLAPLLAPSWRAWCDTCGAYMPEGTARYICKECRWDLCQACMETRGGDTNYNAFLYVVRVSEPALHAEMLVQAGVIPLCAEMAKIASAQVGRIGELHMGHYGALACLQNIARHRHLRQAVVSAANDLPLDRLVDNESVDVREMASRLRFLLATASNHVDSDKLPAEVLARGAKAEALYQSALQGGVAKMRWAKVAFLGEDRAGKTSVLAALSGSPWQAWTESTHGVATSCFRLAENGWTRERAGHRHHEEAAAASVAAGIRDAAAKEASTSDFPKETPQQQKQPQPPQQPKPQQQQQRPQQPKPQPPKAKQEPQQQNNKQQRKPHASQQQGETGLTVDSGQESPRDSETVEVGSTNIPINLIAAALSQEGDFVRVVCKDTAGQPRYYSMLARTLSKRTSPVIVFNLSRWAKYVSNNSDMFDCLEVDLRLNTTRATGGTDEEDTLGRELTFLRYWLSMVLVRTQGTKMMIVGTHLDDIFKAVGDDEAAVQRLLHELSITIECVAKSVGVLDRIEPNLRGIGKDTCIFPVDCSRRLRENGIVELQETLLESLSEAVETGPLSDKIPVSWVKLLDVLKTISADRPLMAVSEVTQIAEHFGVLSAAENADMQVRQALTYFNDIGEISFSDGRPGSQHPVFVDPECLSLAQSNILDCPRVIKNMNSLARELHEDAVLHDELLPQIWQGLFKELDDRQRSGPQTTNEPIDRKQAFVDYLTSNDFLVPVDPSSMKQLWVPSLLPVWRPGHKGPAQFENLLDKPPLGSSIFADLQGISLPELFPRFIAGMLNSGSLEVFASAPPKLYRNAARLATSAATLTAILRPLDDPREIVVSIEEFTPCKGAESSGVVFQAISDILHRMIRGVSPILSEHIVVGPAIPDLQQLVILSLAELAQNARKDARATWCGQLPGRKLKSEELPRWLQDVLFGPPAAEIASGSGVQVVRSLRQASHEPSATDAEEPPANPAALLVEGLAELMDGAKLPPSAVHLAAAWCEDQGVAELAEIMESMDEFLAALDLKKFAERRLRSKLERAKDEMEGTPDSCLSLAAAVTGDKFKVVRIIFGSPVDAAQGIESMLGLSAHAVAVGLLKGVNAIKEEINQAGSDEDRENLRYILEGVAQQDLPAHVCKDYDNGWYHGGPIAPGEYDEGHGKMTFQDFMKHEYVKLAKLTEAEVCSTRLYTTNSYRLFNTPLRQMTKPHPIAMVVYFLVSGVKKLRSVAAQRADFTQEVTLWRGMQNAELDDMEKFNADGGTEMAAMSTSCSKDIALRYAASRRPLLFQYRAKGLTKGVMIDFLSVYPKEKECLYPPGTYLQPRKMWKEGGVRVVEVEPQIP